MMQEKYVVILIHIALSSQNSAILISRCIYPNLVIRQLFILNSSGTLSNSSYVIQGVPLATEPGVEDIATKFEEEYVRCVRNEEECVCSVCL